jgi:plastocyanin
MRFRFLVVVALAGVLLSCGGGEGGNGGGGPNPDIVLAKAPAGSGDGQSGQVGLALGADFCAQLTEDGAAKSGAAITWSTTSGGSMNLLSVNTNSQGVACSRLTLGTTAGPQTARAAFTGATGSPVTFNATGTAGPATTIGKGEGDGQHATINQAIATPLTVQVTDQFGNGVSGVQVGWAVLGGSATPNPISGPTNASGLASSTITMGGTPGAITVTATSAGLDGSPITFGLTADPPALSRGVTVANNLFRSVNNLTTNPAVDTLSVGGTVTWSWSVAGTHSILSVGNPSFTSSGNITTSGSTYQITFNTPGTYQYECGVHGLPMGGRIVVQ